MRRFTTLVLIAAALAACGGSAAGDGAPPKTTTPDATATTSSTSQPTETSVMSDLNELPDRSVITQEDSGKSFVTELGNRIELQLSSGYLWTHPALEGPAQLVSIDFLTDPGFTAWELLIEDSGSLSITASGTPVCDDDDCDTAEVEFEVSIDVISP